MTRRLQVLLNEERYRRLEREADRTGQSVAALIRAAIDRAYGPDLANREAAVTSFLSADPVPVDDWEQEKRLIRDPQPR